LPKKTARKSKMTVAMKMMPSLIRADGGSGARFAGPIQAGITVNTATLNIGDSGMGL
jgi:hypothetical protein